MIESTHVPNEVVEPEILCEICGQPAFAEAVYRDHAVCTSCDDQIAVYANRLEARVERLNARAERVAADGQADLDRSHEMADAIPFGQPILVGHHSEGRDRRYRQRIHTLTGRGFDKLKQSQELERRAQAAEQNAAISSDDPAAVLKLQDQLVKAITLQADMKRINAALRASVRACGTHPEDTHADFVERAHISATLAAKLLKPDFMGRYGFADFELTNNGANIRRLQKRVAELQARAAQRAAAPAEASDPCETGIEGMTIERNLDDNRLRLRFPGKPADDVRAKLKYHGFVWSPSNTAWQRKLSNAAEYAATCVLAFVKSQQ